MAGSRGTVFDIAIVVTPRFNMAATVGFIDPFRAANYLEGRPLYRWKVASLSGGNVQASNGLALSTVALSEVTETPDLAVISSSWTPEAYYKSPLAAHFRRWARFGATLGALDTGAFLLANAGLLEGRRATTHYEHLDALAELYPDVEVSDALYVIDGDRISCCGGAASLDIALQILRATNGPALANAAARYVFQDRLRTPGDRQNPERAEPIGSTAPSKLRAAVQIMERHLDEPVPIPAIAAELGLSQRQLERLFVSHTGISPVRYYGDMRLDHARALITQTEMPLWEVALACGFTSPEHFSRAYRTKFGIAPRDDRIEGRVPFEFRAWPMRPRAGGR